MKIQKIKPLFNRIVTTMNKYEDLPAQEGVLLDTSKQQGELKEYQTVISVGNSVHAINVGDVVVINPDRYAVMKHREGSLKDGVIQDNPVMGYKFDTLEIDGKDCMLLYDSDIKYIIEKYTESPIL